MADDVITELEELGAEKVSGVGSPANGTPWLLLKGTDTKMDPASPHTKSPEADAQEEEMTKGEAEEIEAMLTKARFAGFCGTDDCGVCKERFGPLYDQILQKSKLDAADRRALPKSAFAIRPRPPAPGRTRSTTRATPRTPWPAPAVSRRRPRSAPLSTPSTRRWAQASPPVCLMSR